MLRKESQQVGLAKKSLPTFFSLLEPALRRCQGGRCSRFSLAYNETLRGIEIHPLIV